MWIEEPSLSLTSWTSSRGSSAGVVTRMILICCSSDCRGPPNGGDPIDPTRLDVDSWPVATPASGRQLFLEGLRGLDLILMVLNHTGRRVFEWPMGRPRNHVVS